MSLLGGGLEDRDGILRPVTSDVQGARLHGGLERIPSWGFLEISDCNVITAAGAARGSARL